MENNHPAIPGHLGTIAFVLDERISRQRSAILTRIINGLRSFARIELIGGNLSEDDLLHRLESQSFDLVLAPWYRYLSWSRIEGFYGLTRTSGPTFAGYFCDSVQPYELGDEAAHFRAILLDFANLDLPAIKLLVRSLLVDSTRSGMHPLVGATTPIYYESWYAGTSGAGLGSHIDAVLGLPELSAHEWQTRTNAIRICLTALWSLIYDEGPGKGELTAATNRAPRAYFQVGLTGHCLGFRLCYSMPTWSPRDALHAFWPDPARPTAPAQLLLRYADFTRVHTIAEPSDVEVAVGLFPIAPAERAYSTMHTLWIEPITANLMKELPFEHPSAEPSALLKPLPRIEPQARPTAVDGSTAEAGKTRRFILEAAGVIRELKQRIVEHEDTIRELRSGGIGSASPLPPPDVESLLEAFQERYAEMRYQADTLHHEIARLEAQGAAPDQVETLRLKLSALAKREQLWVRKIASILELFHSGRAGQKRAG